MIDYAPDLGTALFDRSRHPCFVFDRTTLELLAVNDAMCERYGWTREELLRMTLRDIRLPEDVPWMEKMVAERRDVAGQLRPWLSRHRTKSGEVIDVELEITRVKFAERDASVGVVRDITQAAENERRYRLFVELAADGLSVTGADRRIKYMSPAAERMLGLTPGQMIGKIATTISNPDDIKRIETEPTRPGETRTYLVRTRHADGRWRWLESVSTNLTNDPVIQAHVSTLRDVTARVEAEEALKRSEANFRTVLERSPTMTFVHANGRVLYANPAMARALGFTNPTEVVGEYALDRVHPADRSAVIEQIMRTAQGSPNRIEVRLLPRTGGEIVVESEGVRVDFDGSPAHVVFCTDVTERRELYARMAVADRMVSVGTLAAGVAHEINNPLAYVIGNLELLSRELPDVLGGTSRFPAQELHAIVSDARDGAVRVAAIVRELRALSRSDDVSRGAVDIEPVLASCLKMVGNELRHRARLFTDIPADLPPIDANASKLGQVFLNLLVNAAHAIPEGKIDSSTIRVRAFADGDKVVVEIADTGIGIPEHVIGRIFDPFFTTKPVGQGTGLGLAISHEIVRSAGGSIEVESTVGTGTTFRVILPAAPRKPVAPDRGAPAPVVSSRGRVLVVDDEAAVGRSIQALLAPELDVIHVTRGAEALTKLGSGERYDAVLCDLMMPEMSGIELFVELQRRNPTLARRVVFLTGGAFTDQARDFLAQAEHPPLEKPFTEQALRAAIDRLTSPADPA